jgi:hypothetical protein
MEVLQAPYYLGSGEYVRWRIEPERAVALATEFARAEAAGWPPNSTCVEPAKSEYVIGDDDGRTVASCRLAEIVRAHAPGPGQKCCLSSESSCKDRPCVPEFSNAPAVDENTPPELRPRVLELRNAPRER